MAENHAAGLLELLVVQFTTFPHLAELSQGEPVIEG